MGDLLDRVLEAHGGLVQWNQYRQVQATIVTGGAFWGMKGLVQDPKPRLMRVKLHEEWSSVAPFGALDMLTDFTPDRIAILKTDGTVVAERSNPREAFGGHNQNTPWDPLHRAYINGYALWTYLTTPFLLAMNGVQTAEIEPWRKVPRPGAYCARSSRARPATAPFRISSSARICSCGGTTTTSTSRAASTPRSSCSSMSRPTG
jgi:hypothetical protein